MSAARTKLPVWRSVAESYVVTIRKLPFLLRVGWFWLIVAFVSSFAFRHVLAWLGIDEEASFAQGLIHQIGTSLITAFCAAAIAVPWHREILRPAADAISGRSKPWTVFAYALAAFALETVFLPITSTTMNVYKPGSYAGLPMWEYVYLLLPILVGPVMIAALYLWSRLWLILPAIALNDADQSLRGSWATTYDNGWRIMFGCLLAVVPGFLLVIVWSILADRPTGTAASIHWAAFDDMLAIIGVLFGLAFLSISYRELVQKRAATPVP